MDKLILIKGAGDLASAIALRLYRAGYNVAMTDINIPTAVRRTVSFSRAIYEQECYVEDVKGIKANSIEDIETIVRNGNIAIYIDEMANCIKSLKPDVVIDAIIAKKNLNTKIDDAGLVIGVGPGFTPKKDCHCAIETKRGHYIGRVLWDSSPEKNTGVPGTIGGYNVERIIRATTDGIFKPTHSIGDFVKAQDIVAYIEEENGHLDPVQVSIGGVIRGMLQEGVKVHKGMKSGDVDPRGIKEYCFTVSDKGSAIGGGVLEAVSGYYMGGIYENN